MIVVCFLIGLIMTTQKKKKTSENKERTKTFEIVFECVRVLDVPQSEVSKLWKECINLKTTRQK